jgi:hypothetical protein
MYDEQGQIKATAATTLDNAAVDTSSRGKIHKIPGVEVDPEELSRYLADLHANHRIDIAGEPKIIRVNGGSTGR